MKNKNITIVCIIVMISSLPIYAQNMKQENFADKLTFKAGAGTYANYQISSPFFYDTFLGNIYYWGSVSYRKNDDIRYELQYSYHPQHYVRGGSGFWTINENESIQAIDAESARSNIITAKINYFLNKTESKFSFYINGGVLADFQVKKEIKETVLIVGGTKNVTEEGSSNYTRALLGPEAGLGMILNFGKLGFQTEISYGYEVAPFVDRGYQESNFNISIAPVYKF